MCAVFQSLGLAFPACRIGVIGAGHYESRREKTTGRMRGEPRWHVASPRADPTPNPQEAGLRLDQAGED